MKWFDASEVPEQGGNSEKSLFRNALNLLEAGIVDILKAMKIPSIVLGILAIVPIALLINHIFFPLAYYGGDTLAEMACMIFGVPILIFNLSV
ncbi:MAG TPA: hypothetical protein VN843_21380 [Anaerolineales bacterium]|nr:hypothetical protein [Anaerolineales bacterium]